MEFELSSTISQSERLFLQVFYKGKMERYASFLGDVVSWCVCAFWVKHWLVQFFFETPSPNRNYEKNTYVIIPFLYQPIVWIWSYECWKTISPFSVILASLCSPTQLNASNVALWRGQVFLNIYDFIFPRVCVENVRFQNSKFSYTRIFFKFGSLIIISLLDSDYYIHVDFYIHNVSTVLLSGHR